MYLDLAKNYAGFYLKAKSKYSIHSPFVYDLITKVFEDKTKYPDYQRIEELRITLLSNKTEIEVLDYGAKGQTQPVYTRKICDIAAQSSKPSKWSKLLYRLSAAHEAHNILELGTSLGISTACLALGALSKYPDVFVKTIEGSPNTASIAKRNLESLGLSETVKIETGRFSDILETTLQEFDSLDVVYLDGDHRKEPTLSNFKTILPKAHNDTLIILDDIYWSEEMMAAWDEICGMPEVKVSIDLFHLGLIYLRRQQTKEHFRIRF